MMAGMEMTIGTIDHNLSEDFCHELLSRFCLRFVNRTPPPGSYAQRGIRVEEEGQRWSGRNEEGK